MKATYSPSRLESFNSCSLKYFLTYKESLYADDTHQNVGTRKGNAFHKFAELYRPTWTEEQIKKEIKAAEQLYKIPEELSIEKAARRFIQFYELVIAPVIAQGGKFHQEVSFNFIIDDHKFTGRLDVLLEQADGTYYIIDYKTGKSAQTSYYVGQMMAYAWAIHKQYNVPLEEIPKKVKIGLFFPMADDTNENPLKVFKKVTLNEEALNKAKIHMLETILAIEGQWTPIATITKLCEYCPFAGLKQYCKASVEAGHLPMRGIVIKKRDWSTYRR